MVPDKNTTQMTPQPSIDNNNNNNNQTTTTGKPATNCTASVSTAGLCSNSGICYENGSFVWCDCPPGWTGVHCESDVDECNTTVVAHNKCAADANCLNYDGGYNCSCPTGYKGDGYSCTFVDQCMNGTCPRATCFSQLNSHQCICDEGWRGDNCSQDINECESNSPVCTDVHSICINTNGSYNCNCSDGFMRNSLSVCTENRLWRFGINNVTLEKTRNSKMKVDVAAGFPFYGQMFYQIQISSNGYVTFGPDNQNLSSPLNYRAQFPGNVPMLAPYWSDIEISRQNDSMVAVDVYDFWNSTLDLKSSEMYMLLVAQFGNNMSFEPWFAVVITWNKVVPYPAKVYAGFENATFQVVLATNGVRSVAFVNYAAGQMQWNPSSDNRTIVIGITDGANVKFNFTGDLYRPDQSIGAGTGKQGLFFFDLGQPVTNPNLPCLQWYQSPNDAVMSSKMDSLVPCPCSLEQALYDPRFVNDSAGPLCVRHRLNSSAGVNLCCYDRAYHALVVGLTGGYLISNGSEMDGKKKCCVDADLCQLFYMKQMSDNCQRYMSPVIGAIWGDPYISSFAGDDFPFNGKGEYTLFRLNSGVFLLQGRFEPSFEVTTLTAVAIKPGNQSALEVQLKDGGLRILTVDQTYPLPWSGNLAGAVVDSSGNSSVQFHFECDIVLQLSVVMQTLRLMVLLPRSVPGWDNSTGLLVKKCAGTFLQESSESDAYNYFKTCLVTKNETVFMYASDGFNYDSTNNQTFTPKFIPTSALNLTSTPWCGSSVSCVREWVKTSTQDLAMAAKTFEDGIKERRNKLGNFPPAFSSMQPQVIYAVVDQGLNITLNVTDPEGKSVRFFIDTVINITDWQLNENVFTWRPSTAKYDVSTMVFLQFHAEDEANISSLYWPFVHLCPCPIERGVCSYDYPSKLNRKTPQGRLVLGRCICLPGWTGDLCNQTKDVCNPSPCFPGVNCTSNTTDTINGYTCAACPSGLVKDGNWCYDMNECLTPPGLACSKCVNLLGSYICSCSDGYNLSPDQKTCSDVNECAQSSRCLSDGQYCHNVPGSFECLCRPNYFTNGRSCVYAPIKFGGKIIFKTFNITGSKYLGWRDSMLDPKSEDFKLISQNVESLVQSPFTFADGFVGVKATQLQQGSIMAMFNLLFGPDSKVNATFLNDLLEKFLLNQNCRVNGPDCTVSNLVGVNANMSEIYDKDLCQNSGDNMCDLKTMNCRTENGQVLCSCKTGFEKITDYVVDVCEDIDECSLGTNDCNMNMSTCVNTPGSYICACVAGYEMNNGSCTDVCYPNPCANDGHCVPREYDFFCNCVGIWTGLNCTEENPEAIRLRKIAIGIGVGLGILCLILIIVLIVVCIRQFRVGTSYTCASTASASNGNYKGRRSINVHQWDTDEMEFQTNGSHLDQDSQPKAATFTGRENPAYTNSALEINRSNSSGAKKTSSDYF